MQNQKTAFTLIELLVVVTIIVVLLALLVPAMDKAIYQAELAVCAAQLKTISSSVVSGALDYKRYYPDRAGMNSPHMVSAGADTRPVLRQYLGGSINKLLTDPFNKDVDIEGSSLSSNTYGTYWMFFGWQYGGTDGGPGMRRLGDRWTWRGQRYDAFVMDFNVVLSPDQQWSTHPDADGVLSLLAIKDGYGLESDGLAPAPAWGFTASAWVAATDHRGLLDMNFASSDTSVTRYNRIEKLNSQTGAVDERMVQVSNFVSTDPSQMGFVPRDTGR